MVPTFGLFEFEPARKVFVSGEDQERAGYLAEVVLQSTQFGAGSFGDTESMLQQEAALSPFPQF